MKEQLHKTNPRGPPNHNAVLTTRYVRHTATLWLIGGQEYLPLAKYSFLTDLVQPGITRLAPLGYKPRRANIPLPPKYPTLRFNPSQEVGYRTSGNHGERRQFCYVRDSHPSQAAAFTGPST